MRGALGFLTVVGGSAAPDARAPAWFAPVGALVGLAAGGAWWLAAEAWPPALAAVVAVATGAAVTGMLHLDGLADSADGLLPPLPRRRRLDVMATPDVGAFGVVVVTLTLAAQVLALAALRPDPLLLAGLAAATRAAMALALGRARYARASGGLASGFVPPPPATGAPAAPPTATGTGQAGGGPGRGVEAAAGAGLAGGLALVVVALGRPGVAVAAAAVAGFAGVVALAYRRIGGYTGDVLGAAGVVAETVALFVAAARW
jgi:adenosylcobinamide-GDP ribazoletransferase